MIRDYTGVGVHAPVLAQHMGAVQLDENQFSSNRDRAQARSQKQKMRKVPKGFAQQLAEVRTAKPAEPAEVAVQPVVVSRFDYNGTGVMLTQEQIRVISEAKEMAAHVTRHALQKVFAHLL